MSEAADSTTNSNEKTSGRVLLPDHLIPHRYELHIKPDLVNYTFVGECKIALKSSNVPTVDGNQIQLHAKELCFSKASFVVETNETQESSGNDTPLTGPVECEEFRVNVKTTVTTLVFPKDIPTNASILLTIHYAGFLNNQMAGFYRSTYTDIYGNPKIMASTQFEALDARRAFPCWDEPARKAVFSLTLTIPADLTCLSNMPEASRVSFLSPTDKTQHHTQVTFMDSPKMSTYLLAFCVGQFDFLQAQTDHGVLIRVFTPPGKAESGRFALDCAVRSLDKYDDFFQLPYPLPKLDMVAIPEFASGAMENWGLVTYREVELLCDPEKASNQQKQRVCTVVTHELAHQWFGNLVTMEWWDDLWLNEGFASWAENWCSNEIHPQYRMWDQFTTGDLAMAMRLDALKSSHPIQVPIQHAEEVEQVFDVISYCKGGSVVRMICAVLGKKAFQEGLAAYMDEHKYGNTETYHLWNAWEKASGMPVGELMKSWTEQMGFPMLTITKETWRPDRVELELEQNWFLSDGSALSPDEAKKTWTIPIISCTEEGTQTDMTLMREKIASVTIPLSTVQGWAKLNAGQEVPMRVLYTQEMLQRLSAGVKSKALPPCDRAALLTDSYAFVKAGRMAPAVLIELLASYDDEDSYIVWEGLASVLHGLDRVMSDDESMRANFTKFAKKIVLGSLPRVGWEPAEHDGHLTVLLRSLMIGLLGSFCYDDDDVHSEAKRRFSKFLENENDVVSLPSDMRTSVFRIVLCNGGAVEYEQVLGYFSTATDNSERKHVLSSLGYIKDPALKLRTMEWTTSGAVKLQDFFYAMGSVGGSNVEGRLIAWKFFQENFNKIHDMIGKGSSFLMDSCIVSCCGAFCSTEKADEIDAFFQVHPLPGNARKIAQTTENMRTNAKFLQMLQTSPLGKDDFWKNLG